ncbi:hypothetical protein [Bailinhaonella thermotolerans]|uniref:hypothetical protein n=1 Tax=Bailinhaonella thermotolerans TaxID=1070861 RepID=UPI0011C407E9|nr:hypothetical protein [Bailinhaonella thermotolerans]
MREEYAEREVWPFECLDCRQVWELEYLVRHVTDGHGNDVAVWSRNGVPVQPPWCEPRCPACDGVSITTFPAGYLDFHPQLRMTAPGLETAEAPPVSVLPGRTGPGAGSGGRLLLLFALVTIAVLVFAGYEFYEYTLLPAVHH